ncbi:uncharacterized protein N7483_010845 [Penicillium malachiteum]|uniref:uncharacterized protein n=1 Tax=Penicillium malachiteum TaxID=1324776 RepID=UPI0025491B95|nr:uncharacterized protein N7483_010845 [Penicillium malachiteum]KAJ5713664.1 hypothetical protein N7483_010845 [Penicillium malachiteum]
MAEENQSDIHSTSSKDQTSTGTAEKRNAFAELMSPRNKQQKSSDEAMSKSKLPQSKKSNSFGARDGLGAYIAKPETYPSSVVVYHNTDFVAIHDMFPKSSLHILLLPRDSSKTRLHPFDAFEDAEFLTKVKAEVRKLRTHAAAELRRKYGKYSEQDRVRQEALIADPPTRRIAGRKRLGEGDMDRYSERLKHRKHYNSFSTPFFVPIDDFPLAEDDVRRHPTQEGYLKRDFVCWRCGEEFGNQFVQLKEHLKQEFEEWKKL